MSEEVKLADTTMQWLDMCFLAEASVLGLPGPGSLRGDGWAKLG